MPHDVTLAGCSTAPIASYPKRSGFCAWSARVNHPAWLQALLRTADWRTSVREQEFGEEGVVSADKWAWLGI